MAVTRVRAFSSTLSGCLRALKAPPFGSRSSRPSRGPIFFIEASWSRRSSSVNSPRGRLRGELLRRLGVDRRLDLLDEGEHVAEAEDPGRHPVRMERLEVLGLLADPDELDRLAGRRDDGQRRSAAGVAVGLGQDDAGQRQRLREPRGGAHGVLSGHRVGDEEDLLRLDRRRDGADLRHELLVDVQPARRVDDDRVAARSGGPRGRPRGRPRRDPCARPARRRARRSGGRA